MRQLIRQLVRIETVAVAVTVWLAGALGLGLARVHDRFVGSQDHLPVSAGQVAPVWLCRSTPDGRLKGQSPQVTASLLSTDC